MKITNEQCQAMCVGALHQLSMADSLALYRAMFRNYSDERMNTEYGESGRTPREILAFAEDFERQINEAILWVQGVLT